MFQSTRPRGARPSADLSVLWLVCFNPRAHVGRDPAVVLGSIAHGVFQSTRPRGARLHRRCVVVHRGGVSIHAPTWGATHTSQTSNFKDNVSIHAPTWGATILDEDAPESVRRFNPRAHVGRDSVTFVSVPHRSSFNPRAHVGRDESLSDKTAPGSEVSIHAPTWGATA